MRLFPGLSCVTLSVRDLERATIFYEMLGWRVSRRASSPGESFFQLNNLVLALRPLDRAADEAGTGPRPILLNQHYGSQRAVTKALEVAARAGAIGLSPPERLASGGSIGGFSDPDGHAWRLAYDPAQPPAPDGTITLPA